MRPIMEPSRQLTLRALPLAIATALFIPAAPTWADGLQALIGHDSAPSIHNEDTVPIIDIVAPNAAGLSHNLYSEYNVGSKGVVLNNSLVAGHSELAGKLQANSHFNGTAATTILNEVVGHNRSNINGPQVIFGTAADYVLANPNGIALNGATLDNAPRATFVVGSANVVDGRLSLLDTQAAHGTLRIESGGASNPTGGLTLIAPTIGSNGLISAAGDIDLVLGSNVIDYADNSVSSSTRMPKLVDANLLGAMATDKRIRIVSSEEGAGIKMPSAQLAAGQGIRIESAGNLNFQTPARAGKLPTHSQLKAGAGDIHLTAGHQLNLGSTRLGSDAGVRLAAEGVRTQGADIQSGAHLQITAASVVNAGSSRLQGGDVSIDVNGKLLDTGTDYSSSLGKIAINADNHEMKAAMNKSQLGAATTATAKAGSLNGAQGIDIRLAGSGRYEGTHLAATQGPVSIKAGANLTFNPAYSVLERTTKKGVHEQRTAANARIDTPASITLHANRDVQLNGIDIGTSSTPAGSLNVTAGGTLTSMAAADKTMLKNGGAAQTTDGVKSFGQHDESSQIQHGNQWRVKNDLTLQAGARKTRAIHLQGVQADARNFKLKASAGGAYLEAASSQRQLDRKHLSADASNPLKPGLELTYRKEQAQTYQNAVLHADTLTIDSQMDVRLDGARVDADHLNGQIKGKLLVNHRADSTQSLDVQGSAQLVEGTDPGKMLNEMALMTGKWSSPGKDALALQPEASKGHVEKSNFEFTRVDNGGAGHISEVVAGQAMNLKALRGTTVAVAKSGTRDLKTTHTLSTGNGGLDAAKQLYDQVRIR